MGLSGNGWTSQANRPPRKSLALDASCWKDLCEVFDAAIPSLHRRTFPSADANAPDYDTAPSSLIATNCGSLLKDLEILTDLVAIARNLLTVGETVQNLAVKSQFDQLIFSLIHTCVKITARGYDGDTGAVEEERGQAVINSYKKLLITCLQFLNNLVAQNERRKLTLWVELFDNSAERENLNVDYPGNRSEALPGQEQLASSAGDSGSSPDPEHSTIAAPVPTSDEPATSADPGSQRPPSPFLLFLGREGADIRRRLAENGDEADPTKVAAECERKWKEMGDDTRKVSHTWNDTRAFCLLDSLRCGKFNMMRSWPGIVMPC
jgi:palmitoyltransferase